MVYILNSPNSACVLTQILIKYIYFLNVEFSSIIRVQFKV